jgi:hypothetical protein
VALRPRAGDPRSTPRRPSSAGSSGRPDPCTNRARFRSLVAFRRHRCRMQRDQAYRLQTCRTVPACAGDTVPVGRPHGAACAGDAGRRLDTAPNTVSRQRVPARRAFFATTARSGDGDPGRSAPSIRGSRASPAPVRSPRTAP